MENVQFQCGKCGKLLAVGADLVGNQVRCPECELILIVPAPVVETPIPEPEPEPVVEESDLAIPKPTAKAPKRAAQSQAVNSIAVTLLIFFIPYSLLATGAALYFMMKVWNTPSPLELLPDWPRDNQDAAKRKAGANARRVSPDGPLPGRAHVKLGERLRIGDLEVVPEKVERRKIDFRYEVRPKAKDTSENEALVLTLRLRNLATDYAFVPDDLAFRRLWKGKDPADKPYTFLEVGDKRFYGGSCAWSSRADAGSAWRQKDPNSHVEGQQYSKMLDPGETMTTIVCTNPEDGEVLKAVSGAGDRITWRVQLRRGLVSVGDEELTATGVVAVDFTSGDIEQR